MSSGDKPGIPVSVGGLLERAAENGKPPSRTPVPLPSMIEQSEVAIRQLTFWKNGFKVDGVDIFWPYNDPQTAKVLEMINSGAAPPNVLNVRPGQPVEVRVLKRTDQDFIPSSTSENFGKHNDDVSNPSVTQAESELRRRQT